ncbi:MAG: deoxyribose-phosphate aldolase [Clostridiales bacterium]|nr:deoxyribose-phosphate aldolase [Clostridiales bacterium]
MDIEKILGAIDHTCLKQDAVWSDIKNLCDEAIRYRTASVCIPPSYVKKAAEYVDGKIAVCTTIGFPNGYSTTAAKCFETREAVNDGADEIDMVINIGWLKDKRYDDVLDEIRSVKQACSGKALKVIIETCLLTTEEKIKMCEIVSMSGAEYIKTSTGFSSGGATFEDIKLFREHLSDSVRIKASGGIRTLEDAWEYIQLGVSRLGTSSLIKQISKLKE